MREKEEERIQETRKIVYRSDNSDNSDNGSSGELTRRNSLWFLTIVMSH